MTRENFYGLSLWKESHYSTENLSAKLLQLNFIKNPQKL